MSIPGEVPSAAEQPTDDESIFGDVIAFYSRAQAIEDGVLVDITEAVRTWFKIPVAATAAVWAAVETNETASAAGLALAVLAAIRRDAGAGATVYFDYVGQELWAIVGPGDTPEPVMTIMLVGED